MTLAARTLQAGFAERVLKSGEQIAYIEDGQSITWRMCAQMVKKTAGHLAEAGVQKGDRVGIWGVNALDWVICFWSLQRLGAVAVLLNPAYRSEELHDILKQAEVGYLAVGELKRNADYRAILAQTTKHLPSLKKWFCLKDIVACCAEETVNKASINPKSTVRPEDTAVIVFTSGTTRRPKGVMLGHGQIMKAMSAVSRQMHWQESDRLLMPLPMFHGSGLNCGIVCALQSGMAMVIQKSYRSREAMAAIEKYRCTAFNAVPSMLILMASYPTLGRYDLSSLKSGIVSGAGMSPENYRRVREILGIKGLVMAYGMTETTTLNTMASVTAEQADGVISVGKALPEMPLRIWSCESDREAAVGEIGEIQLKGYCIMQGYYALPELTKKVMTADGWFHTGDAGFLDHSGNLYFKTRLSELIVRGGENISPAEIEAAIEAFSDAIRMVKVVGVPDPIMQEEVAAVIQMGKGELDRKALTTFLRKHLAYFKVPKYIFETKAMPMTQSGKIDFKAVKSKASQKVKQLKENQNE